MRYPDPRELARVLHDACPVDSLHIGESFDELYGRERAHWEDMALAAVEYLRRLNVQ
jgi:hypothetical protein